MKQKLTLLILALLTAMGAWATDYSGSYYYIRTSNDSHYGFYSAASGTRITTYGSTSSKTSAVIFKFEKTGTDDEYYWYNCTSKKYISVDASGYLLSADSYSDTDAYKWYIIDNGDGTVKITDKAHYNSGTPSNALVTLGTNGSWWGVNDLSNETYTNKTWKLIPAVEMKKPYYIGLGRGGNRYLQHSSDDNKMKQVVASTKDLSHVWYFTDEGDGVINIHPITSSSAMGYASNASAQSDKISTANEIKSFKITPTDQTTFPIAFLASDLSTTLYISNYGGTDYANMGLYGTIADPGTRMKVEDASLSVNAYIGATKTIGATEWKTQSNWLLRDTWNSNGPGYSSSNMWSPIYLNGVTATGIEFDGWALQLTLVNSSLTATTGKIQASETLTIDVDKESTLDLTLTSTNNNPGTHVFNIDGALTINMGDNAWNNSSSTNNINLGTTGSFTFTANSAITIGANPNFTINATLADPGASYDTVESQTLATFTNVTITTLSVNISGTDGWTSVDSKAALETQTSAGKYYFLENTSSGVVLYMYKQTVYNVPAETTVDLSEIDGYSSYEVFNVPSGATLNVDVDNFDLTKIHGAGTVTFNGATTTTSDIASDFTGTLNVNNASATVTINGNLGACTLQKTLGTLNYAGNNLNGTTLDGVVLNSTTARITTSNTVNIKNLAGCNLPDPDYNYGYVFIGSGGTINLYGTCDFTKKADGTTAVSSNLGYGSSASIVVKEGATVTVGLVYNSGTNNASVTVESDAILNTIGWTHADNVLYATNLTNNGTINLSTGRLHENIGTSVVHTTFSGSGTLNITEGANLEVSSVPSTITLSGAGTVKLSTFPSTTAPTRSDWTGAIEFPNGGTSGTNLEAIFNAWGNTNSTIKLNNVKGGYLGNNGTVNPTLNILSGKTLTLNNGFSSSNSTLTKVTGAGTLDRQGWDGSNNHNLIITTLTGFTGTLSGTGHPIIVQKLVLATEPAGDALLVKTSESNVTLNDVYVGSTDITEACSKKVKTVNDVTGYYVTNKQDAIDAIAPYVSFIASGVGRYTVNLGSTPYTNVSDLETAISGWATLSDCVTPVITINQPTSAFYRIKSGDKYLQDIRKSDSNTERTLTDAEGADESAETIFYLNGNTFVGYKTGFGFGSSVNMTKDTEQLNSMLFTESAEKGKYTIQAQQGTCASTDDNEGYWGVDGSDLSREDDAASGACWTIEEVTSLPVTITSVGLATLYSPVALTIPTDVTAYVVTSDEETCLRLAPISDGIIPANTGVILEASTGTYNFDIATGGSAESELTGTVATISRPEGSYVLSGGESGLGFYAKGSTGSTTIPGFKAYYQPEGEDVKGFVGFFFDNNPDAINDVIGKVIDGRSEIFNLAGQRMNKMQKGINIVNGKKILK